MKEFPRDLKVDIKKVYNPQVKLESNMQTLWKHLRDERKEKRNEDYMFTMDK